MAVKTYYQIVHYFLEYCERVLPDKEMCDDLFREYLLHSFEMKLDWQIVNSVQDPSKRFCVQEIELQLMGVKFINHVL